MDIGLKEGTVRLEPHDPAWERLANEFMQKLWDVLKDDAADIQHIGSTSIKQIAAKPIIDIAVAVKDNAVLDKHLEALRKIGMHFRGELNPGRFVFNVYAPDSDICKYHVHIMHEEHHLWRLCRLFRDYLNEFPEEAKAYEALKISLARQYTNDRSAYTNHKAEFISNTLLKAEKWRKAQEE